MQLLRLVLPATVAILLVAAAVSGHNITKILAKHPEFSTFNHYLTLTHLAGDINSRTTITVCAVDNAAMNAILAGHPSIYTVKNILSVHVLLDYFGAKKLHQITDGTAIAATMFQATGTAQGSAGFVNITDQSGGKVGFAPQDNDGTFPAHFVKSVQEIPYNLSVIQISQIIPAAAAAAPTPGPPPVNLTGAMSAHGCKVFADTLLGSEAIEVFQDNVEGGLTVFCPMDEAFKAFMPKFKNLTKSGKTALLQYHGIPVFQSKQMLKSNNGVMNTLATDGANKYDITVQNDGEEVTLKTKVVTAKLMDTLLDQDPVAIYSIDKVLMPRELFKGVVEAPAPAPAPEKAPKKKKKATKSVAPSAAEDEDEDADAPAPDDDPADATADDNGASGFGNGRFGAAIVGVVSALLGASLM